MEHIMTMIHRGVQTSIQPLERLESQEKVNQELYKKLDLMSKEVNLLKEKLGDQPSFPALPEPASQQDYQSRRRLWGEVNRERRTGIRRHEEENNMAVMKKTVCTLARRILSFSRMEPRMLEIQVQSYGAKDLEKSNGN